MRRRRWLAALALLTASCASAPAKTPDVVGKPGTVPSWLPAYSREQLALLEPGNEPVPVPALRTYPDPALFRYSHDRVLSDPRDAMRTTKLVADIVSESPRTYTVTEATPRIANDVAQYGPPPAREPDIWLVAKRDPAGRLQLVSAEVSKEAKEAYDEGHEALKKGRAAEAVKALRGAVRLAPSAPPLHLELGRALVANKQLDAAEAEFREVIHLDPTLSFGHEELASLLHQRGDVYGARTSIAHALAYHPNEEGALDLASKIAPTPGERPVPFSIFLEVDPMGVVRVASGPTVGARMYAGCRAVMRYEPELREALFGVGPNDPYFLSVAEEMFCIESAIGAFVAERAVARDEGRSAPEDTQTSALTGLAHTEGLLGFVMYEILGRHRPEHARTAPAAVHRATVRYVQQHILNYDPGPNPTNYVASAR